MKDGEVIIVDEFTGRQMPGRRWSDGLHQAVEAKEGVKIERENQTLATITFQNYFRMYKKLAGMTGTAETEAAEFGKIYKLDVVVIPTNRTLIRKENPDVVYRTEREKFEAVVNGILQEDNSSGERHPAVQRARATSAGGNDFDREIGNDRGIAEESGDSAPGVERQAARAGIANRGAGGTQGRGDRGDEHGRPRHGHSAGRQSGSDDARTLFEKQAGDAVRGGAGGDWRQTGTGMRRNPRCRWCCSSTKGKFSRCRRISGSRCTTQFAEQCKAEHDEVVALGGLHILGTERHEARRIDNQLRGRAGRQGDPGSSRFFLSLEDDLMRIFGGERVKQLMFRLGMTEGVPIESTLDFQPY